VVQGNVLDGSARWCNLANTSEASMCSGDTAFCTITLTSCCYCYRHMLGTACDVRLIAVDSVVPWIIMLMFHVICRLSPSYHVVVVVLVCAQTLLEELIYFAIRYIPTVLVCVGCHAANLFSLCSVASTAMPAPAAVANSNTQTPAHAGRDYVTCHLAFGNV